SGKLIHVGFQVVSAREAITADVRLILAGQPQPVREGSGTLEQVESTVKVHAMPDKLPPHVAVDVSNMQLGTVLQLSAIAAGEDYEFASLPETVIAVLHSNARGVAERAEEAAERSEEPVEDAAGE